MGWPLCCHKGHLPSCYQALPLHMGEEHPVISVSIVCVTPVTHQPCASMSDPMLTPMTHQPHASTLDPMWVQPCHNGYIQVDRTGQDQEQTTSRTEWVAL